MEREHLILFFSYDKRYAENRHRQFMRYGMENNCRRKARILESPLEKENPQTAT